MNERMELTDGELEQFLQQAAEMTERKNKGSARVRSAFDYLSIISKGEFYYEGVAAKADETILVTDVYQEQSQDPTLRLKIAGDATYLNLAGKNGKNAWVKMSEEEALEYITRQAVLGGLVATVDEAPQTRAQKIVADTVTDTFTNSIQKTENYARDFEQAMQFLAACSDNELAFSRKKAPGSSTIELALVSKVPGEPYGFKLTVRDNGTAVRNDNPAGSGQILPVRSEMERAAVITDAVRDAAFRGGFSFDTDVVPMSRGQRTAFNGISFAAEERRLAEKAAEPVLRMLRMIEERSNGAIAIRPAYNIDSSVNYWVEGAETKARVAITVTAAGKMYASNDPDPQGRDTSLAGYDTHIPADIARGLSAIARTAMLKRKAPKPGAPRV